MITIRRLISLCACIFFLGVISEGQAVNRAWINFYDTTDLKVNALCGGVNLPQFSKIDLNNDTLDDLFIFDKEGFVRLTFINKGEPNVPDYHFAPDYIDNFPSLKHWVLLRDYNCDGIEDIFAYSQTGGAAGFEVYTGSYDSNDEIQFSLDYPLLLFPGSNGAMINLYVSKIDYPAVDDIDGDGDLDIVTFTLAGSWVEYYKNQSVELGYGCDTLIFNYEDDCWGRFVEDNLTNNVLQSPRMDSCMFKNFAPGGGIRHAGSTLLTYDADNDCDKELVLGDISFDNLVHQTNMGNCDTAWMQGKDQSFPNYDVPAVIPFFPAAFYLDLNNDGLKDLVASPSASAVSENYETVHFFQNVNSNEFPIFEFVKGDYLVDEMTDYGSGSAPTFFDYDHDGLLDLLVGSFGDRNSSGIQQGRLILYRNTGTPTTPVFTLEDDDYLEIKQLNLRGIHPTTGDVDGDGDADLLFGTSDGILFFYENQGGPVNPAQFGIPIVKYGNIDVGAFSTPQLVDVDFDDKVDLLIGERNGNLNYFHNNGTSTVPQFDSITNAFGGVDTRTLGYVTGYSAPNLFSKNGSFNLLVGSENRSLLEYSDIDGNLNGNFSELGAFGEIFEGNWTRVATADLNADGSLEYMVGNQRGGLALYSDGVLFSNTKELEAQNINQFTIIPNPANTRFTIASGIDSYDYSIHDALGKLVRTGRGHRSTQIDASSFRTGMYFVSLVSADGERYVQRLVIAKN